MKTASFALLFCYLFACSSCHQDNTEPAPQPMPQPRLHTVIVQPNSLDGQDSYVAKLDNEPTDGNVNLDFAKELIMGRWKASGNPNNFTARGFLKSTGLNAIPKTATVSSAKLYLYGMSSSPSFPQGNSTYPGSTNASNASILQRVTGGNWDEATITFNNMPASTDVGQIAIPASTSQFNYNVMLDVTDMVKQMVVDPTTIFGFSMRLATETPSRELIFATSENDDVSLRPKLVVEAKY